ncbi:MAG: Na(+)/H(+) antiporter subunit [Planctomycetota bacterium]|jgi:NAD(P)H-quinone oxidoreductase subunit 5
MSFLRYQLAGLIRADSLSWVMAGLILFIITIVSGYSHRYLAGDRNRRRHRVQVLLLAASVLTMVFADHLLLFFLAWSLSNLLLVKLMIHKNQWQAAFQSGLLAARTFGFGSVFLGLGLILLAMNSGTARISQIVQLTNGHTSLEFAGLLLIAIAAMTQSASWPFHRWLTSSLNSPTPVSALMHAGIINAGGLLLVRFGPLYASHSMLLHGLFLAGLVSALVGTFWKLLQTDVKRMLACSTMGQMGFMLMQCGMGLFAPAISHLCWHGLFKAYLFLNAGSVLREKRNRIPAESITPMRFLTAFVIGICGAILFGLTSQTSLRFQDTSSLMVIMAFMVSSQLAASLLSSGPFNLGRFTASLVLGCSAGALYGLNLLLIEFAIGSALLLQPQPLDPVYIIGFGLLFLAWIFMSLNLYSRVQSLSFWKRLYVASLNASQPHSKTVTANRTAYQS